MKPAWWVWPGPSSRKHRPDSTILYITLLLLAVGLIVQFVIGPAITSAAGSDAGRNFYFYRHLISVVIGLVAMVAAWKVPLKYWVKLSPWMFIGGIVGIFLTLAIDGLASRWIQIGFFSFQPIEVVKMAFILGGASYIAAAKRDPDFYKSWKPVQPFLVALLGVAFLVVGLQRDLGSMFIVGCITMAMLFISGFSMRLFLVAFLGAGVLVGFFIVSTEYRRDRVNTFINGTQDCTGIDYHVCQATIAVGSGGLTGRGIGKSVQVYGYLPEANNDSVFAIYAEIIGFVGSIALFAAMFKLYSAIYIVAKRSEDILRYITVGILAWFSIQSIMNIGAMIGLLPLKGITLPYISYGGSSLMLVLFATGILLQISAYTVHTNERSQNLQNSANGRRVRRPYNTYRSSR